MGQVEGMTDNPQLESACPEETVFTDREETQRGLDQFFALQTVNEISTLSFVIC